MSRIQFETATDKIDSGGDIFTKECLKNMQEQLQKKSFPITLQFDSSIPSVGRTTGAKIKAGKLIVLGEIYLNVNLPAEGYYIVPGGIVSSKENKVVKLFTLTSFGVTKTPTDLNIGKVEILNG